MWIVENRLLFLSDVNIKYYGLCNQRVAKLINMNCVYVMTYFQVDAFFRCDQSVGKHVKGILHLSCNVFLTYNIFILLSLTMFISLLKFLSYICQLPTFSTASHGIIIIVKLLWHQVNVFQYNILNPSLIFPLIFESHFQWILWHLPNMS